MQVHEQVKVLGRRLQVASMTLTGSFEQLLWDNARPRAVNGRQAVTFKNIDPALTVYLILSDDPTADLGTMTANDRNYDIPPGEDITLHLCEDIDILAANSSGDGTTSLITGLEVGF